MNKGDFYKLLVLNITHVILIIEWLFGLELAFQLLICWTIISLIAHIYILRDYITFQVEEA